MRDAKLANRNSAYWKFTLASCEFLRGVAFQYVKKYLEPEGYEYDEEFEDEPLFNKQMVCSDIMLTVSLSERTDYCVQVAEANAAARAFIPVVFNACRGQAHKEEWTNIFKLAFLDRLAYYARWPIKGKLMQKQSFSSFSKANCADIVETMKKVDRIVDLFRAYYDEVPVTGVVIVTKA